MLRSRTTRSAQYAQPDLATRALFITEETLSPEVDRIVRETGVPVIAKPFDAQALRAAIAERLSGGRTR
jgi:hypothetical protein